MTPNHGYFEELCALAACEQLTSREMSELHEHSEGCSSCAGRLIQMKQVSAQLFCIHTANQSSVRMPKDMLERFIARANREGVPLTRRTANVDISGPALAAVLLLVILALSASWRFRTLIKSADAAGPDHGASVTKSVGGVAEVSGASITPEMEHARRTAARQKPHRDRPEMSIGLERSQFDVTAYSRSLAIFHSSYVAMKRNQSVQWIPTQYRVPRFHFVEPVDFVDNDPPRLLAEYQHQAFGLWSPLKILAPGSAEMQVLRRDFEPDAHSALLNPDFRKSLPAFQFTPIALQ